MKVKYGIEKVVYHPLYVILVILVIFPINFTMMIGGQFVFGLILFLMQVPWLFQGFAGKFEYTAELLGIDI